ncbi:cupin domain-containing protein [Streptomyces pathocidini]|uniref:Cupin domain-containing protein n=1 Tax=Streptomyces pathocidini TaxID=1650571 RepID=A0ABW7UKK6_9ACTN|nr:hypothetical protein [Streptomyces pathocidini]
MSPTFDEKTVPALTEGITALLPFQGSFELQQDQAGKVHDWHFHSLDEELFILRGEALLFWDDEGKYQEQVCEAGTWITLPAGTRHGSLAGAEGVIYMIRPENGRTAETTFLAPADHPHTSPRPEGASA